jgi:hypothetical protein
MPPNFNPVPQQQQQQQAPVPHREPSVSRNQPKSRYAPSMPPMRARPRVRRRIRVSADFSL